jgi:hypothetical protein
VSRFRSSHHYAARSLAVGRVLPLAYNAFEAEFAGVKEDGHAVVLVTVNPLVDPNAGASLSEQAAEI